MHSVNRGNLDFSPMPPQCMSIPKRHSYINDYKDVQDGLDYFQHELKVQLSVRFFKTQAVHGLVSKLRSSKINEKPRDNKIVDVSRALKSEIRIGPWFEFGVVGSHPKHTPTNYSSIIR